jgi:predicted metallopeptidase
MNIKLEINDETIRKAASLVMEHYKDEEFLVNVRATGSFNHTKDRGNSIADKIIDSNLEITIKPYKTFSPWSKVIGYAKGNVIYVNTRKFDLPLKDRVENIFHEFLHTLRYSHKGNRVTAYNLRSVPYAVSSMFVKYLESIGKV